MSNRGPHTHQTPARSAALLVGSIVRQRNAFTQDVLAQHVDASELAAEEKAFATKLALGVSSTWGTLDEIIDRCLRSPSDIMSDVRDALRISAYELIFLKKDPHAAVDQGVELAKSVTPKVAGLANVVLRNMVRLRQDFPFGDTATDDEALARYHAFPLWLAKRLIAELGRDAANTFMAVSNEPAPLFVAVNHLKATEEELFDVFKSCGGDIRKIEIPQIGLEGCYRVRNSRVLVEQPIRELFDRGAVLVSDAAAQAVAALMTPTKAPAGFLEIGSGRGTKTLLLQSNAVRRFGAQMDLSILDNHEFKIKILKKRLKEYGAHIDQAYLGDARKMEGPLATRSFSQVFIDAPCSGLGTLRRHPEIRWKLAPEDVSRLAASGLDMLCQAAERVHVGGTLGYATCTVLKEENAEVIRAFLTSKAGCDFKLVPIMGKSSFATVLSPASSDAHFAVRMLRQS